MDLKQKFSDTIDTLGRLFARHTRGFACTVLAASFSLVYHICALVFFYRSGIMPMFFFNIFSVVFFAVILATFIAYRNMSVSFFASFFEVVAHQILSDYFLGGLAGFHFLILILVIYPYLIEREGFRIGLPISILSLCVFFACEFVFSRTEPLRAFPEEEIRLIRFVNICASMLLLFSLVVIFKLIVVFIEKSMEELNEKNEALLENILPKKVVENLRRDGKCEPEQFSDASILFTDIVGFTAISKNLSPKILVGELNDIYTNFDRIIGENRCVRIKTIGDSYMAVCGLPEKDGNHARNLVSAAISCRDYIRERNKTAAQKWSIRLGIHTGSVTAGIVGTTKYLYDVFGDSVNVASRMESNGEAMKICTSEAVFRLLKNDFSFEPRGQMEIKGKGRMNLYFVERK